ncbi:RagB/SusD family nutrient uptake outer membrane protein [Sphingobacterium faecale]|uniref:RagB/SusD family nutrient uptake outer membrane protein n=1 Tax=Sphingobacterium faecale TaxID=2803775 RepID=A0ABS1R8I9_9SPHI|nr:RagB/SusD family nutrient uptake outer membrane protein [Sphingobacterium faecale]MBL1410973.1 RagB/SusD family nutrient uptake outer membrane protein [Sphingobacterium faecale]
MRLNIKTGFCISFLVLVLGCADGFLDVKQDQALRIPNSLEDVDALLKGLVYNSSARELAIAGGDEYQLTDAIYNGLRNVYKKNAYIWADSVYLGERVPDWNLPYYYIMNANLALEVLEKLPNQSEKLEQVKSSALFHRAYNFYVLSQSFAPPFHQKELNAYGLPLRLESDVSIKVGRSTIAETYQRIVADLEEASVLINDSFVSRFLPSKRACYALLARVYLVMGDFDNALKNAELCLSINDCLNDFNELNLKSNFLFTADLGLTNKEIIFYDNMGPSLFGSSAPINKDLVELYSDNDLRKIGYFRQQNSNNLFKGSYTGGNSPFCGLANDEIYLIKAESLAHLGRVSEANETLNVLLKNRCDKNEFIPIAVIDKKDMLRIVFEERRKELVLRGLRWEDLRRLGWMEEYSRVVSKEINGKTHTLNPKSTKFTFPIPEKELELNQMVQTPR